jgi:hypothetical protein
MNHPKPTDNQPEPEPKPGFFTRIFSKVDNAMKTKADEAAKNQCCNPDDKGKGGKCC